MANFRYFNDAADGTCTELSRPRGMARKEAALLFPGTAFKRIDSFDVWIGGSATPVWTGARWDDKALPVTRMVEIKARPSLHKCDARCTNAKGFRCECECGGKNHGAGSFICEALAA